MGQHRHAAEVLQRARVVGMGRSIQDQPQHRQISPLQGLQAQQGVIQGAQTAARHQHNRQLPALQLIDLQPLPGQGNHQTAGGLHHQGVIDPGTVESVWVEHNAVQFGRPVGRDRLLEGEGLRQDPVGAEIQQGLYPMAVAPTVQPALHRLPVMGLQALHQPGADHGFAHVGIGAADDELGVWFAHRRSIRVSTCQVRLGCKGSGQARAS